MSIVKQMDFGTINKLKNVINSITIYFNAIIKYTEISECILRPPKVIKIENIGIYLHNKRLPCLRKSHSD